MLGKIVQSKLKKSVDKQIGEEPSGFRPGRTCVDNLFNLQQLVEKQPATDQEVHLASIDLEKAYNTSQ